MSIDNHDPDPKNDPKPAPKPDDDAPDGHYGDGDTFTEIGA